MRVYPVYRRGPPKVDACPRVSARSAFGGCLYEERIMDDALSELTTFIAEGSPEGLKPARDLLEALFGTRYHKRV